MQALQGNLIDEQPYWLAEAQMERLKPFLPKRLACCVLMIDMC